MTIYTVKTIVPCHVAFVYRVEAENEDEAAELYLNSGADFVREEVGETISFLDHSSLEIAEGDPAAVRYVIQSTEEKNDYWSNEFGWVDRQGADIFTAAERKDLRLPIGGRWIALRPYSVLLLYPDYATDLTATDTYYAFVEAPDPIAAVEAAQRQAVAAQAVEIDDPTDFQPLLVIEGHHASQPLFNK